MDNLYIPGMVRGIFCKKIKMGLTTMGASDIIFRNAK